MDIADTILAKSDQVNAVDLAVPVTVTVEGVDVVGGDQPVNIHLREMPGKAYRPSKSMRRVLVKLWGPKSADYAGRRLTIYNDPSVTWAGKAVGGVRISHASGIEKPVTVTLALAKGKQVPFTVQPLPDAPQPPPIPAFTSPDEARTYWTTRRDAGATSAELAAIQAAAPAAPTTTAQEN